MAKLNFGLVLTVVGAVLVLMALFGNYEYTMEYVNVQRDTAIFALSILVLLSVLVMAIFKKEIGGMAIGVMSIKKK